MTIDRLRVLWITPMPPSPPRFGAQARIQGLLSAVAGRHEVHALSLVEEGGDEDEALRGLRALCPEAWVVRSSRNVEGAGKRLLQLRSLASRRSFEALRYDLPGLQAALDDACGHGRYDVVNVEFPFLMGYRFCGRGGEATPVVMDAHNIEFDLVRQSSAGQAGWSRRIYNAVDWRKLRREERAAFRRAAGVAVCSRDDEQRLRAEVPGTLTAVVPNGADVERFRPRPEDPPSDGRTVMFFGTFRYFPNVDGILYFLREIWPRIAGEVPQARLEIAGLHPPAELLAHRGERVEVAGFVEDLRPHVARSAVLIAPLRIGGGTRLKILEGMAMARPYVSTALGAEGIEAVPGQELLLADDPAAFAAAVVRLLREPALAQQLGQAGRGLVERRYSWEASSFRLEELFRAVIEAAERPGR